MRTERGLKAQPTVETSHRTVKYGGGLFSQRKTSASTALVHEEEGAGIGLIPF